MAVAIDARGTKTYTGSGTTADNSSLTVGSGSNRALVVIAGFGDGGAGATTQTAIWDPVGANQSLTQIKRFVLPNTNGIATVFGLVNPTAGNKIVRCATNGAASDLCIYPVAYTGVDQTGGTTSFPNNNSASGSSTGNASMVITSAVGNWTMAIFVHNSSSANIGARSPTEDFYDHTSGSVDNIIGWDATGAATVTYSVVLTGTNNWAMVGCDILAVAGAAAKVPYQPWLLQAPLMAQ